MQPPQVMGSVTQANISAEVQQVVINTAAYTDDGVAPIRPPLTIVEMLYSFKGRIKRSEWWLWMIATYVFHGIVVIGIIILAYESGPSINNRGLVFVLILIPVLIHVLWVGIAIYVKRFHDLGHSGWMVCLGLIPYIGGLILLIMCGIIDGNPGPNKFGLDAKMRHTILVMSQPTD
jgi:uncharacterized membrane protein YhaH (DUF805 family)